MSAAHATAAHVDIADALAVREVTYRIGTRVVIVSRHTERGQTSTIARTVLTSEEARELASKLVRAADFIDATPEPESEVES